VQEVGLGLGSGGRGRWSLAVGCTSGDAAAAFKGRDSTSCWGSGVRFAVAGDNGWATHLETQRRTGQGGGALKLGRRGVGRGDQRLDAMGSKPVQSNVFVPMISYWVPT
jgi:hypothetical protein